jgi:hypothetical protein
VAAEGAIMQLERIGVALRPRTALEAMDLGAVMLRAHARQVWSAWFAFTFPIFLVCQLIAWLTGMPWLGLLLPWWLRPLFARIPLYVLSRAVFERTPTWRETLKGQMHWPWTRTIAALTWLRLDTHRAVRMPMELLEGVSAKQRAARWRVLSRPLGGRASGLTWTSLLFELVLFVSIGTFALWLIPSEALPDSMRNLNQALQLPAFKHALVWTASVVMYVSMSVIEPLYMASGFALYLNRRTQLEAWDIDLMFRRLRQRLIDTGLTAVLLIFLAGFGVAAHAADIKPAEGSSVAKAGIAEIFHQPVDDKDASFAREANFVYLDPHFGAKREVSRWVLRSPSKNTDPTPSSSFAFGELAAGLVNVLMWALLGVAIVALIVFTVRRIRISRIVVERPERTLTALKTSTVQEAVLPDDLAGSARELWRSGHRREALSLLYRGSMQRAAAALHIQVPVDATEADWLRHAKALEDASRRDQLVNIVRTWQLAAYANRYPGDVEFGALLTGWPVQRVASP